jgi:hypothetical protein
MNNEFDQPGRKPLKDHGNKIGIAVDNYKIKRFRKVLLENGYKTTTGIGLTAGTSFLYIEGVDKAEMPELKKILERLQFEFANRN